MNVFNKVTFESLKRNRTRTVVTIVGIILSAAMICAVTTFASSLYNFALELAVFKFGNWHGSAMDADIGSCRSVAESPEVDGFALAKQLGYAKLENCSNTNKPYLFVLGAYENFGEMMPVHITSGKYPEEGNEILIPEHLNENGGIDLELGDVIELELGLRILDGASVGQSVPFFVLSENGEAVGNDECLVVGETRKYTVVGFYERPSFEEYTAPGYTAITLEENEPDDDGVYDIWFRLNRAKDIYGFMEEKGLDWSVNDSVLIYSGVTGYDNFKTVIAGLAYVVIGLIVFGSVSLIYNAFSISVSERTRQFGLLSSVGATKKQLRRMVITEALMVGAVGVPIGIASGIGGIGITLLFIGNKFKALVGSDVPMRLSVSLPSVAIAVSVAFVTVLISAVIPSRRATRVSAIEAIRQNRDVTAGSGRVRTPKLVYKIFGLPGMLASKYYKRSRKKYRATVVSLFMSVVLFVSASAFTAAMRDSVSQSFGNVKYDILVYGFEDEFAEVTLGELLSELKADSGVEQAVYSKASSIYMTLDAKDITRDFIEYYAESEQVLPETVDSVKVFTNFKFVDDETFRRLLDEYGCDEEAYFDPQRPVAVAVDGRMIFDIDLGQYTACKVLNSGDVTLAFNVQKEIEDYYPIREGKDESGEYVYVYENYKQPGETLVLTEDEAIEEKRVNVGKVIYDQPYYLDVNSRLTLIYPMSLAENVLPEEKFGYGGYNYYIIAGDHGGAVEEIEETLADLKLSKLRVRDIAEEEESNRSIVTIVRVFAYGFIVLISLIAAANVFNTVSTNIALRRREFAMLESVGMTAGGFDRMMGFECILYGTRALILGIPVSVGISYLIHLSVSEGYRLRFELPWGAIAVAVFSVFIVVFSTMLYSMRKIKRANTVESLKNENL